MNDKSTLEVKLSGGLGNQMFQCSAGLGLLKRNNFQRLILNASGLKNGVSQLADFKLSNKIEFVKETSLKKSFFKKSNNVYKETSFTFDDTVFSVSSGSRLDGYFQSPKYFENVAQEIDDTFRFASELQIPSELKNILIGNKPICAIHMRRGDYFSNPTAFKIHGTLDLTYFKRAISMMIKLLGDDCNFVVFSDDIDYAKAELRDVKNCFFVEANALSPAHDMILMSKCKNFIISNSTYSWWSAYLGRVSGNITIAPVNWFSRDFLIKNPVYDLIPPGWILI